MIQIETGWLLLIPIFFGLGWLASRWDLRLEARQDERERLKQQRSTFKGLNLLLNEQPDQAIETLVKVAQLDPETVDLHFSLGNLFRRRGETERAIRVHQHLANREDLKPRDRDHAGFRRSVSVRSRHDRRDRASVRDDSLRPAAADARDHEEQFLHAV